MLYRFLTPVQLVVTVALFVEIAAITGVAAFPGVSLWLWTADHLPVTGSLRVLVLCMVGALGYFIYGLTLILVIPVMRWVTFAFGTPVGRYPYASFRGYQWASYNALILAVRYSFVNWIRATPFNVIFYRLMGMKAGARVQINTAVVADCNLLAIGEGTVIGGDVTLIAHSVEGQDLVSAPVRIGRQVTVGLMSVVMPGCTIGDRAILAANAVLKKGTTVGDGEVWGGVPARKIGVRGEKRREVEEAEAAAEQARQAS